MWTNSRFGAQQRDTVTLESAGRGMVVLRRSGTNQLFEGAYAIVHPDYVSGSTGPVRGPWSAVIRGQ
ncbi:MAG: hypothetical protein JST11_29650 [Acidobacteria bacterium]|nr:hypothetical protein [Acidobacteriota bacterium]